MDKTSPFLAPVADLGNGRNVPFSEGAHSTRPCTGAGTPPGREDLAHRISQLQEEIGQLHCAIDSHAVVDQAIGVVISLGGLTPDQGFDVLRTVSQHTNVKLRKVAEQIIAWAHDEQLDQDIRQALNTALHNAGAIRRTTFRAAHSAVQNGE
ncbi:ANTAR domain-containing protein [Streptomyces sp. NPDC096324]|uniref:ANTAR domain-containing protein n=1 Tax=Streptomyces sp. NPDC096324 TaxID=3366085 RepID=UPI0037FA5980